MKDSKEEVVEVELLTTKEVIERIKKETGIISSKSKIYHYHRYGLLEHVKRGGNNYRKFNINDYYYIKAIAILADLGVSIDMIKSIINTGNGAFATIEHLKQKSRNIRYIIKVLEQA